MRARLTRVSPRPFAEVALCLAAIGLASIAFAAPAANAGTIRVTTTEDQFGGLESGCALREAIDTANAELDGGGCTGSTAGQNRILLPAGTYRLTETGAEAGPELIAFNDLDVSSNDLVIEGPTRGRAVIDAGGIDRAFENLNSNDGDGLVLRGLEIRGGIATTSFPSGGGVLNRVFANLTLDQVTVTGNRASGSGAGIFSDTGQAVITNSTISGNGLNSEGDGGGIGINNAGVTLVNTTVSHNAATDAGGIHATSGGGSILRNTIVAANTDAGGDVPDCGGTTQLQSEGNNLIGSTSGCTFFSDPSDSDLLNMNPRLGPLANNGGSPLTVALLRGSPAINRGLPSNCPPLDQRGLARSLGGRCDIGAYERVLCAGVAVNRIGSAGRDGLTGTPGADGLLGLGARDVLKGRAGRDGLCGGRGRDLLFGGPGRDKLIGGPGGDRLRGGPGRDLLRGGPGRDRQRQ